MSWIWSVEFLHVWWIQVHALVRWLRLSPRWFFWLFKLKNVERLFVVYILICIQMIRLISDLRHNFLYRLLSLIIMNLIKIFVISILVWFFLITTPFHTFRVIYIILVTICWKLVTTWRNVSSSVVHDKLELLSHFDLNISFKTLKVFIPDAPFLDVPRIRMCELTKHLYMLVLLDLLMISLHRLEINCSIEYSHHFVSSNLSKHPEFSHSLGYDHGGSHSILIDPSLHSLFYFDIHYQGFDYLLPSI